jgi:4-alpha-glucanotransferase
MSRHFQAVRLDHVLGFFRIWEISNDSLSGLMGCFNPVLPLREEELEREGIRDLRRLTEPFITEEAVLTIFGRETGQVKSKYLNKEKGGLFSLKPAFQTQRKIEEHFAGLASLPVKERVSGERIKKGLRSLVTNVILLKDPAQRPGAYHFRINMNKTSSFLALSKKEQEILERLYVDYFYKRQEAFWDQKGRQKLPVLRSASNMLICGEDLGMVPDCVPVAMQELDLVSLRIQRMPKEFGREFGRPEDYPYLSVATTSSHDMPPLRAWWEEGRTRTVRFYKEAMKHAGDPPLSLEPWIAEEIILRHLESSSILAIFPIQDLLAMDLGLRRPGAPNEEQINDPSDPHHYWRFRLHLTLEELMVRKDFSDELAGLIKSSGRLSAY